MCFLSFWMLFSQSAYFLTFSRMFLCSFVPDEKEEGVLGSLPLLSFKIGPLQTSDNINRKFAFKVGDLRVVWVWTVLTVEGMGNRGLGRVYALGHLVIPVN